MVREAFKDLLKGWGRAHDLIFVPEYEIATTAKDRRYVDGALLHRSRFSMALPSGLERAYSCSVPKSQGDDEVA